MTKTRHFTSWLSDMDEVTCRVMGKRTRSHTCSLSLLHARLLGISQSLTSLYVCVWELAACVCGPYMHRGPLFCPQVGTTSLMFHTVMGGRIPCRGHLSIRESQTSRGSVDTSVDAHRQVPRPTVSHGGNCMDAAPWGRPGHSRDWAQDILTYLIRLLPTWQTSFHPVSSEQIFSEVPGAQLPNGLEPSLWTDNSASREAAPALWGEPPSFLTAVAAQRRPRCLSSAGGHCLRQVRPMLPRTQRPCRKGGAASVTDHVQPPQGNAFVGSLCPAAKSEEGPGEG